MVGRAVEGGSGPGGSVRKALAACGIAPPGRDHVAIEWHEPHQPRLLDAGSVKVACHLYDATSRERPPPEHR
jgi:hypothetical protein